MIGTIVNATTIILGSIIGSLLITGSGLSLLNLKDCKTLNLLPALLVPVVWFLICSIISV